MRFQEHDCPGCGCPTLGHAVDFEARTLCRDCFLDYIARGDGDTLEERLLSSGVSHNEADAAEVAAKMRQLHAELPR